MASCALAPEDRKAYGKEVGEILVRNHGKKKFYSPQEVKTASSQSRFGMDWHCWAMCLYTSPSDFETYHRSVGETCDYGSMKAEMTFAMTDGASESWFNLDVSWLDWPDIELSSVFDLLE